MSGSSDRMIEGLVADLEPVRRLPRLRSAFAVVLAIWAAALGVVLWGDGARSAAEGLATNRLFMASFLGLLVAALGGTASALAAGRPDRGAVEVAGLALALVGLLGAAIACLVGMEPLAGRGEALLSVSDGMCFRHGLLASLLPGGVLLSFLVRGWTARPVRASLIGLGAAGALGAVVIHLGCDVLAPRHWLLGHLSVPIVLAGLGLYPLAVLLKRLRG